MEPSERVEQLQRGADEYKHVVSPAYDEVVQDVAARAAAAGSLGKLDLAALSGWKRLRGDTRWMAQLMGTPDVQVREHTGRVVSAARDEALTVPAAGAAARSALTPLPGFGVGDALASAVCFAAAPERLAVYDRRAHAGLSVVGLGLEDRAGRYGRYLSLIEQCRGELADHGVTWTARQVDLALYALGGR